MDRTHFKEYEIGQSNKEVLTVSDFLGVDYSESQINLPNNVATEMVNIMDIDGVNQVRDGFECIANIPRETYRYKGVSKINPNNVNAVWAFKNKLILHVGNLLYACTELKDFLHTKIYMIKGDNNEPYFELENYKSKAFLGKNGLYILGGNGYYLLTEDLVLENLEDNKEKTYIPTTATAITSVGSGVASRNALDDMNLMTQWQKNKLISGQENKDDSVYYTFELTTPIKPKNLSDLNDVVVSILSTEGE